LVYAFMLTGCWQDPDSDNSQSKVPVQITRASGEVAEEIFGLNLGK